MTARFAAAIVTLTLVAGASPANAAPLPIQGLNGVIEMPGAKGSALWTLGQDCIAVEPGRWQSVRSRNRNTLTLAAGAATAVGSMDGSARAGDAHEKKAVALAFHDYNLKPDRVLNLQDLGIELRGSRAYLTGRLVRGKPTFAAVKRVRLATIARPRFFSGNATVPGHPSQTQPDTFLMAIQGNATVAAPLAKALNRIRCRPNKFFVIHPRPVRQGIPLGFVAIQLMPGAAVGVAGLAGTSPEFATSDGTELAATAIAPATLGKAGIGMPVLDGTRAALTCSYGRDCRPATGAQLGLAGGITVSTGGRSATIDGIQVTYAGGAQRGDPPVAVSSGRVDGQPMNLTSAVDGSERATPEFLQALSSALGVTVATARFSPSVTFTQVTAG
ncbi:MAG TPA: hypothetical protein VH247_09535 [Thermoleophilaceae bacterium]|nr:hypothetical protein [Thermoleophilaceae bacterium]